MGLEVVACDINEELLDEGRKEARHRNSTVTFIKADALSLEFPNEHFDAVVMMGNTIIVTQGPYDPGEGTFECLYQVLESNRTFTISEFIWSPWTLRHVVEESQFTLQASQGLPPFRYTDCFVKLS